jgi:hypothetical protein
MRLSVALRFSDQASRTAVRQTYKCLRRRQVVRRRRGHRAPGRTLGSPPSLRRHAPDCGEYTKLVVHAEVHQTWQRIFRDATQARSADSSSLNFIEFTNSGNQVYRAGQSQDSMQRPEQQDRDPPATSSTSMKVIDGPARQPDCRWGMAGYRRPNSPESASSDANPAWAEKWSGTPLARHRYGVGRGQSANRYHSPVA